MNTTTLEQLVPLGLGGVRGAGPGIAGFTAWFVAAAVLILLVALAWWTARPAGRVTRDHDTETPTTRSR